MEKGRGRGRTISWLRAARARMKAGVGSRVGRMRIRGCPGTGGGCMSTAFWT